MKICFIWINRFRNFNNLGFNVSSSSKFSFDPSVNKLSFRKISSLPKNFFGGNVTDVVGVIGKNGSGKSNAVELVCKALKGGKTSLQGNFFIITEEYEEFTCHYSQSMPKPNANFNIHYEQYSGNINPLKVVFFSNVYDERRNNFDLEVSDISANNLLSRNSIFRRRDKITDFEKQIKFINSKTFRQLNIDVPTKIQLTSKVWMPRFNSSTERNSYGDDFIMMREFKSRFRERLRDIKPENKFIYLLRFGFFLEVYQNFLKRGLYDSKQIVKFKNLGNLISDIESFRSTEDISENLISFLENEISFAESTQFDLFMNKHEEKGGVDKIERLKKQIYFIKNLKHSISTMDIEYFSEGSRQREIEYFTFNFKPSSSKSFIEDFVSLFSEIGVFEIKWLGISSGHKAYLNLFASIQHELRKVRQPNLLLCIDEGDLYLHPKWQIEFFDKLLSVLQIIFSGKVQIILTSHSPFLLSDLPNQCVTILDNNFQGSTMDGVDLKIKTFGGNLYDLYSEPFFLGNKRTSDFAYNKIKILIEEAEKNGPNITDNKNMKQLSEIIGDEVIRFRLNKIFNSD